jgi:hypothetical protein
MCKDSFFMHKLCLKLRKMNESEIFYKQKDLFFDNDRRSKNMIAFISGSVN